MAVMLRSEKNCFWCRWIPSYHLIFCFHHPNICGNFEDHLGESITIRYYCTVCVFWLSQIYAFDLQKIVFLCIPFIALIITYVFPRHCSNVWFTTSSFFDTSFLKIFNDFYPQQTSRQSLSKQLFFNAGFFSLRNGCHQYLKENLGIIQLLSDSHFDIFLIVLKLIPFVYLRCQIVQFSPKVLVVVLLLCWFFYIHQKNLLVNCFICLQVKRFWLFWIVKYI